MVGDVGLARERDGNDLLRLIVVERLKNELVEIFDIDGGDAGLAGGVSGMFGQGVSWRTMAHRDGPRAGRVASIGDTSEGLAHGWRLRKSDRVAGEGK